MFPVVPRTPCSVIRLINEFCRHIITSDRLDQRLRSNIARPSRVDPHPAKRTRILTITRSGLVAESQCSSLRSWRNQPQRKRPRFDLVVPGLIADQSLGSNPKRFIGEITGITGRRLQDTQSPAATHKHRSNLDRLSESDSQMSHSRIATGSIRYAAKMQRPSFRPDDRCRPTFPRLDVRYRRLRASDPLSKRRVIQDRRIKQRKGLLSLGQSGAEYQVAKQECPNWQIKGEDNLIQSFHHRLSSEKHSRCSAFIVLESPTPDELCEAVQCRRE